MASLCLHENDSCVSGYDEEEAEGEKGRAGRLPLPEEDRVWWGVRAAIPSPFAVRMNSLNRCRYS